VSRTIVWVSAGAASAVAAKLTITTTPDVELVYTDPGSEHPDNARFLADLEVWFDMPVTRLQSKKYADTWQVWEERRYLVGPSGALCTAELKRKPRFAFQRPDDVQVFGYTVEEQHRADRFRQQNPEVTLATPLIDMGLTKDDCLAMIARAGITLPAMYLLGYRNNNCIGCPKGGIGYWNKIRRDFPDTFTRMATLERTLGHTCLRDDGDPLYLDDLDAGRGSHSDEPDFECSLLCAMAEQVIQ
jgi:3'-phosphoadenosine 5'-phosphosulfate sulfotransferase (PAPS reductase)/FAD synthetase